MATELKRGNGALTGLNVTITRPANGVVTLGWIAIFHGLNGSAAQAVQGFTWGKSITELARCGFGLIATDMPNWPSSASRTRIDNLWTYYQTLADAGAWWHVLAHSDGGAQFLDWVVQTGNAAKCHRAWLVNPVTDPRWAYALAGYTPAYSTGGVTPDSGWPADMDSQFAGNWAANSTGYRINDNAAAYRSLGVRTLLDQASDDATLPPAAAGWFVGQVNDAGITSRSPQRTGGHNNTNTLDIAELEAFFRAWTT